MAAENVFATQITLGLIGSGALNLLKKSSLVSFVNQNSTTLNHAILLATSAAGALGVHTAWNASQHSLTITGLDLATIAASLWLWAKQWTIQFLVHRGAFGAVGTPSPVMSTNPIAGSGAIQGKAMQRSRLRESLGRIPVIARVPILVTVLFFVLAFVFTGCAAGKYNAAKVNQTVTMVIADAGTVAISAEQAYQSGKIPQTTAARTAINDLGSAYEDAKRLFSLALLAEGAYNQSESAQLAACQPATSQGGVVSDPANCKAATQAATSAKSSLDTAQANLSASLNALTTKTAAVKALPAQ